MSPWLDRSGMYLPLTAPDLLQMAAVWEHARGWEQRIDLLDLGQAGYLMAVNEAISECVSHLIQMKRD